MRAEFVLKNHWQPPLTIYCSNLMLRHTNLVKLPGIFLFWIMAAGRKFCISNMCKLQMWSRKLDFSSWGFCLSHTSSNVAVLMMRNQMKRIRGTRDQWEEIIQFHFDFQLNRGKSSQREPLNSKADQINMAGTFKGTPSNGIMGNNGYH